jgi:hypothetical protein
MDTILDLGDKDVIESLFQKAIENVEKEGTIAKGFRDLIVYKQFFLQGILFSLMAVKSIINAADEQGGKKETQKTSTTHD